MNNGRFHFGWLIMGISIIILAVILANPLRKFVVQKQSITVTGSAKKEIKSDLGTLSFTLISEEYTSLDAYNRIEAQKPKLFDYLNSKGFPADKIRTNTVFIMEQKEYTAYGNPTGKILGYEYSQTFLITSSDVNQILAISLDAPSLIQQGLNLRVGSPEFHYTKLADLKIGIQAEAAKDAKNRALKIAESTGSKLGNLINARMGVMQIVPKNSNEVSDYGFNDVSSIEKEIIAVVNATFILE